MDTLSTVAMAAPAEGRLILSIKRLALVFALVVGIGLPVGYFCLQYSNNIQQAGTKAELKAKGITALVAANPELWGYQLQRVEELLLRHPPQLADDHAIVRDAAGNLLATVGVRPPAPVLVLSSPVYDSGRVVGQVEIMHSYRDVMLGALGAALLGLMLGGMAYAAVYLLPLRALRRFSMALDAEQAALRVRDERFRNMFDRASDGIMIVSLSGKLIQVNESFARMHGYRVEEMLNMSLSDLDTPESSRLVSERMRTIEAGNSINFEVEHHHKDGHVFSLEVSASRLDADGETLIQAFYRDITGRKQAELALTRQKDLYDMLSQTNKAIVYLTDRDALFGTACRIAVEHGRFRFAWIGLVDKDDPRQKLVARYGEDAGYIDQLNRTGDGESDMRRGLTGRTLLSGSYAISNDFLGDPAMAPWHEAAQRAGVRASAKFPIRQGGVVFGAINLYAGEPGFFTEDLVATLDEMAHDVSFALDNYARETARRTSVAALREGEERYRKMFRANPHPMWVYDLETLRFLEVNDAAISHYGWSRAEFLAMSIADIRPPADVPRLTENIAHVSEGKVDAAGVWTHRKKNGALIAVEITSHILDFEGRRAEIVLVNDITERQQSEQALRAAEEQFRGLVEQSITGIYIIQDGKFAYANPRYAEILGYDSVSELIGRDALSVVAEKDRDAVMEIFRRQSQGEVSNSAFSFTAQCKDGSVRDVGVHGAVATYRGRPAIIGLMQDITEKKHAEEQIQQYVAQLEKAFMSTVEVATTLSEMRDPYTAGHERRVAEIAVAIGAELGYDARRQEGLRVAGYLHDLGKIIIPTEILIKPGKLSPIEFTLIKGHAQASHDILRNVEFPWPVAQIVLQHHERMDGSGYPEGLQGEAILPEARILAVADVVEAMSSHRPYRPGLGIDAALAEIERGRATAFDPDAADACLRLFREKNYTIPN